MENQKNELKKQQYSSFSQHRYSRKTIVFSFFLFLTFFFLHFCDIEAMTSIEESEWDVLLDENGRTYYKNKITDTIQYEAPYEMMMKAWKNADASLWYFDLQIYAYACLGGKEESSALKERQVC